MEKKPESLETVASAKRHVPFTNHLGARVESAVDGASEVILETKDFMLNSQGACHGGVVMSILDCAMAHAALSKNAYLRDVVTVSMSVNFIQPTLGRLYAVGKVMGGGKKICLCEAKIIDEDGGVTATALGTLRYV